MEKCLWIIAGHAFAYLGEFVDSTFTHEQHAYAKRCFGVPSEERSILTGRMPEVTKRNRLHGHC
jgi:hypothetical protein